MSEISNIPEKSDIKEEVRGLEEEVNAKSKMVQLAKILSSLQYNIGKVLTSIFKSPK